MTADASGYLALALCPDAEFGGKAIDREAVAVDAEAAQRREGGLGRVGMVPETLARVNIADVHFNRRNFHPDQRVMHGDRGVGIAAGIDDDADRLFHARLMDEVDQLAFAVGL